MLFISFIFMPAFLPGLHTKTGVSKVGDLATPRRPWTTFGPLSRGFSQQDMPRQSFVGHSGHMTQPT